MCILACDVGFRAFGWSVIKKGEVIDCGTIITEKSAKKTTRTADDYYSRSTVIASALAEIIKRHDIKGIVGELPSGGAQSAKAMVMMNMATAVVASVAAILSIPCEWCSPAEVKIAVCGYRSATKHEIMTMIKNRFAGRGAELFPEQLGHFEHIADSVGAYLALSNGNIVRMFGGMDGRLA